MNDKERADYYERACAELVENNKILQRPIELDREHMINAQKKFKGVQHESFAWISFVSSQLSNNKIGPENSKDVIGIADYYTKEFNKRYRKDN